MSFDDLIQAVGGSDALTRADETIEQRIAPLLEIVDFVILLRDNCFALVAEFDARGLLDEKFIVEKGLAVAPTQGLDEKVIAKYNTCSVFPSTPNAAAPLMVSRPHLSAESIGIVVQSLGLDGPYRTMASAAHPSNQMILYHEIRGIIDGLSMRADQYNKLHAKAILDVCHDKRADKIIEDWKVYALMPISADTLKSHILVDLEVWFRARADKINSRDDFVDLLLDQKIIAKILFDRLQTTKKHGFYTPEQTITYLYKHNVLTSNIIRNLKVFLAAVPITARMFKEMTRVDLNKTMSDILLLGVSDILNELDKLGEFNGFDITIKEFYMAAIH